MVASTPQKWNWDKSRVDKAWSFLDAQTREMGYTLAEIWTLTTKFIDDRTDEPILLNDSERSFLDELDDFFANHEYASDEQLERLYLIVCEVHKKCVEGLGTARQLKSIAPIKNSMEVQP